MTSRGTLWIRSLKGVKVFKDQEDGKFWDKVVGCSSVWTLKYLKIIVGIGEIRLDKIRGKKKKRVTRISEGNSNKEQKMTLASKTHCQGWKRMVWKQGLTLRPNAWKPNLRFFCRCVFKYLGRHLLNHANEIIFQMLNSFSESISFYFVYFVCKQNKTKRHVGHVS